MLNGNLIAARKCYFSRMARAEIPDPIMVTNFSKVFASASPSEEERTRWSKNNVQELT